MHIEFCLGILLENDNFEGQEVDGGLILKWMLGKDGVTVRDGWN
jgi:hypothetical protein